MKTGGLQDNSMLEKKVQEKDFLFAYNVESTMRGCEYFYMQL